MIGCSEDRGRVMPENDRKPLIPLDLGHLGDQWTSTKSDQSVNEVSVNSNQNVPGILKDTTRFIIDLVNSNTGLSAYEVWIKVTIFCKDNHLKPLELDSTHAILRSLVKRGKITRVKTENTQYLYMRLR